MGAAALLAVAAATIALARLKPAAPTVEAGTLWIDSVKRGTMVRQVHGAGVLVQSFRQGVAEARTADIQPVPERPQRVADATRRRGLLMQDDQHRQEFG